MFPGSPSLPGPGLSAAYPCTIIPIRYSYKIHSLHTIIGSVISGARKLKGAKKACVWARVHPASDMDKKEANFPVLVSPFFFPAAGGGGPTTCDCSDGAARQVDRGRGRYRVARGAGAVNARQVDGGRGREGVSWAICSSCPKSGKLVSNFHSPDRRKLCSSANN